MILKPPRGAILNRTHPLAKGLRSAYLLNEHGGATAFDSANYERGLCSGAYVWDADGWRGTDSNAIITGSVGTGASVQVSVCVSLSYLGYPLHGQAIIAKRQSWSSSGMMWQFVNDGSVLRFQSWTTSPPYWVEHHPRGDVVYSVTARSEEKAKLYKNGVYHSDASAVTTFGTGASAPITIGNVVGGGELYNGTIKFAYIYDRILNAQEVSQFYAEPYAMFESPARRKYFYVTGGEPPTTYFIPQFMNHKFIPSFMGGR